MLYYNHQEKRGAHTMRYFINRRTGGLTTTNDTVEAERLQTVGFTEISKQEYDVEYIFAWKVATGEW
jgi:hypothetical protein